MLSNQATHHAGTGEVGFRLAIAADAEAIVDVFRTSIPEAICAVHILGAPMAPAFVRESIDATYQGGDAAFGVAESQSRLIGFVQIRRGPSLTLVEHLHVMPSSQRQGLGSALLRLALGQAPTERIGIDVFRESEVAMRLYRKIGFEPSFSRHWRVLQLDPRPRHDFYVRNLPQARAIHHAYSISMLQVDTSHGSYEIGRIGERWFRVASAGALEDDALLYALWCLDPSRSIVAVLSPDDDPYQEPPMLVSHRLEGNRSQLVAALSSHADRAGVPRNRAAAADNRS